MPRASRTSWVFCLALAALAGGCDLGVLHVDRAAPRGDQAEPANPYFDPAVDCSEPPLAPGPQVVRRLTNREYLNTVRDVLGVDLSDMRSRLPRESYVSGFKNTATGLVVSRRLVEQYARLGAVIAERIDAARLSDFGDCTLGESRCEEAFVRDLGLRLFRRPVNDDEAARFMRLFRVAEAEGDGFERASRLVVEAMVQSPAFLYRLEASNPAADLPSRRFDLAKLDRNASDVGSPGDPTIGEIALQTPLEAGRYRVAVSASSSVDAPEGAGMSLLLDDHLVGSWEVGGRIAAPYPTELVVGESGAGQRTLTLQMDEGVEPAALELVGPLPASLDLGGPEVADDIRPVDDYEMASRLSYFIWHSAPDEALLQAAAAGELRTRRQIVAQAERMLDAAPARRAFRRYLDEWLRLDFLDTVERSEEAFPEFRRGLIDAMKEETYRLFEQVAWDRDADMLSVFTADRTWTTGELAALYDLEPKGEGVAEYDLREVQHRRGLLTHASFLTLTSSNDRTSPVRRGIYVRTRFMCQPVSPPPGNVVAEAPEITPGASVRERFAQHVADPQCAYCHQKIDPIGFGLEHYDALGAFRTHDAAGEPIDATGRIEDRGEVVEFDGAGELGEFLSDSASVEECMVQNVYQYALGRPPRRQDVCDLREVRDEFRAGGRGYRDLVLAVVVSDAFRHVRVHDAPEAR